jgi:putative nucleotidyltransferase with HDIG domain
MVVQAVQRALDGESLFEILDVGGTQFESWFAPVQNRDGGARGVIGVASDVTARRKAEAQLQTALDQSSEAYEATIEGWAKALELRERETAGHSRRVVKLTLELARRMGMPETEMQAMRYGALLHDIGKLAVPDHILLKPGALTEDEWATMRQHPTYSMQLLSGIAYLQSAIDIPFKHHERWDGSGYPGGMKGEEIPLVARIFAVVDVWDALTSNRPYRPAWTREEALRYINRQAGASFDPQVVASFMKLIHCPPWDRWPDITDVGQEGRRYDGRD